MMAPTCPFQAGSDPKQLLGHLLPRHSTAVLHKEHHGGCLCAWAMVAGSLRQLFSISATSPTTGVHRKDDTLLFGVEKEQFLCSGQQSEHKRHTELHPPTSSAWLGNICGQFTVVISAERQKKIEIFPLLEKKNLSEEHAAEHALTSPAPHMEGRAA